MNYLLIVITIALVLLMFLSVLSNRLPYKWLCNTMGWHLEPRLQGFDGCSFNGVCPRCKKKVLQDSQGNWFRG